jgi:catechol 2,3-dioxygenase-like lactoylglutathione lyase family enzyme
MNDATPPAGELFVTQFLVVSDQERSRDFYQSVFGADVVRDRDPVILALANTRIVLDAGDTPTDDKPTVRLAPPADPDIQRVPEPPGPGHRQGVPGLVGQGRHVPHRAKGPRVRNPRLHPRPERPSHRGRPDHVSGAAQGRTRVEPVRPPAAGLPGDCRGRPRWAPWLPSAVPRSAPRRPARQARAARLPATAGRCQGRKAIRRTRLPERADFTTGSPYQSPARNPHPPPSPPHRGSDISHPRPAPAGIFARPRDARQTAIRQIRASADRRTMRVAAYRSAGSARHWVATLATRLPTISAGPCAVIENSSHR